MAVSEIKARYDDLCRRVEAAAGKAGRSADEVQIIAVTKTVDIGRIQEAIDIGITHFGENYVQEASEKITSLGRGVKWHFIGHLQKNKAPVAVNFFDMIQSVDSVALAERLEKRCSAIDKALDIMLQVHYGEEETKHGFEPDEVRGALEHIGGFAHLKVKGLMTIPPFVNDPELNRKYFREMRELSLSLKDSGCSNGESSYLSMGMTDDFEIAIEEGSNMIRIGRAIFGERH